MTIILYISKVSGPKCMIANTCVKFVLSFVDVIYKQYQKLTEKQIYRLKSF